MSMPAENQTNLALPWEEPTEAVAPIGPQMHGSSPGFDLDCLPTHNFSIQSFQHHAPDSSLVDYPHHMSSRPYATNWSIFDNYNSLTGFDLPMLNENSEPGYRVRMNSMASSASSLSYNLTENRFPGGLPETSEAHLGYNVTYQPAAQSSYETTYAPNYEHHMLLQPNPIFFRQAHSIDLGVPSRSFNEYSENYHPNIPSIPKVPSYCMDRPYRCDQCGSSFSRNHDLKRHSRIHLDVKPFPCSCCDKAFARKDALKRHLLVKGCSQSKQCPTRGNSQNEKPKSSQNTITPHKKKNSQQSSPSNSSVSQHSKINKSETNESLREIKLQNIKCTIPNFL